MITAQGVFPVEDLVGFYSELDGDTAFEAVMRRFPADSDEQLADLVEADGRLRMRLKRPVTLQRYLAAIPDLARRPEPLDAAIDMALRALAHTGRADDTSVGRLVDAFPELSGPIREAAALNNAVWSTRSVRRHLTGAPVKDLPCDFGPELEEGVRRYELRELLGEGAFGQVYLAVDRQLSEQGYAALVSIKLLPGGDAARRRQLIDEATKARRIEHPGVVRVLDRGVSPDDEDFLVYEFVDGGDLARRVRRHEGGLGVEEAVRVVARIARGVHAAHMAGLVHCDLKPNNIVVTAEGEPKVADFGAAVRAGAAERSVAPRDDGPVGNLAFMSPEQFRMEPGSLTIPSDVYALGGILYWLLTGKLPNGQTPEEIRDNHDPATGRADPPRLRGERRGIGRDLEAVCRRALAPAPADRYGSAGELAADLEAWQRRRPIAWTRPSLARRLGLWSRRRPALAAAWLVIALLGLAGIAGLRALHVTSEGLRYEEGKRQGYREVLAGIRTRLHREAVDGLAHEVLPQIWTLEWLFGPNVYASGVEHLDLWDLRLVTVRRMLAEAKMHGRDQEFRTMMWEAALAFWLINDAHYGEAEIILAETAPKWAARLEPDDPWLAAIDAMTAAAAVGRLAGCDLDLGRPASPDAADSTALAAQLERAVALLGDKEWGTPVHHMALYHLLMLYEPGMLHEPHRHAELLEEYFAVIE